MNDDDMKKPPTGVTAHRRYLGHHDRNGSPGYLGPGVVERAIAEGPTPTEELLIDGTPPYGQDDFLFGRKGPWPQPSPSHPLGQAPAVVHLPTCDQIDWELRIGLRYTATLAFWWPAAVAKTIAAPCIADVTDKRFDELLTTGIYTKFLTPTSLAELRAQGDGGFGAALEGIAPDAKLFVIDLTPIKSVRPYEGMYVAPTVTLVQKDTTRGPGRALAIRVNNVVVTPTHGAAWRLARYYVLQGASYGILFTIHPNIHFPYDSINAITVSSLPKQHPLLRLLYPHLRFSLVLDDAVLESSASVISNYRVTLYDPFTARMKDGLAALFNAGYAGVVDNPSYPPYRYQTKPRTFDSAYSEFLSAYYPPFLDYARAVLAPPFVERRDPFVTRWARYIHQWLPSFPDGDQIWEPDVLPSAVAGFMWDVSLGHSADHTNFAGAIAPNEYCFRLRLPPPSSASIPAFDHRHLSRPIDLFKAQLATKMFFAPTNVTLLVDTRYAWDPDTEPQLTAAENRFQQALREVEAKLKASDVPIYVPLSEVPSSIQY
jgi:hypothetical protein